MRLLFMKEVPPPDSSLSRVLDDKVHVRDGVPLTLGEGPET